VENAADESSSSNANGEEVIVYDLSFIMSISNDFRIVSSHKWLDKIPKGLNITRNTRIKPLNLLMRKINNTPW